MLCEYLTGLPEINQNLIIFRRRVAGLREAALARFVKRACAILRIRGAVNVLVTGSRELRILNNRFRKKDKNTDVLSFPSMPTLRHEFAGDIAISSEIANQNSRRLGNSAAQEVKILTLHGILHLAGYDHEHDRGRMARKERQLRTLFSLPDGLIERSVPLGKLKQEQRNGRRPAKVRPSVEKSVGAVRSERDRVGFRSTASR